MTPTRAVDMKNLKLGPTLHVAYLGMVNAGD